MKVQGLSIFNYNKFKNMCSKSSMFNSLNNSVYDAMEHSLIKNYFLVRKNIYIFKESKKFLGYMWVNEIYNNIYYIEDLYIEKDSSLCISSIFDKKSLIYESKIDSKCNSVLSINNFNIKDISDILTLNIKDVDISDCNNHNQFEIFNKNRDESTRCNLQNRIFESDSRIPISVDDIFFDERQDYYIQDGFIFIKNDNEYIGMGQVILIDDRITIVNFGIVKEYRHRGYAKKLLNKLIEICIPIAKNLNKDYIYIRVSRSNNDAYKLYDSQGFKYKDSIITWER